MRKWLVPWRRSCEIRNSEFGIWNARPVPPCRISDSKLRNGCFQFKPVADRVEEHLGHFLIPRVIRMQTIGTQQRSSLAVKCREQIDKRRALSRREGSDSCVGRRNRRGAAGTLTRRALREQRREKHGHSAATRLSDHRS